MKTLSNFISNKLKSDCLYIVLAIGSTDRAMVHEYRTVDHETMLIEDLLSLRAFLENEVIIGSTMTLQSRPGFEMYRSVDSRYLFFMQKPSDKNQIVISNTVDYNHNDSCYINSFMNTIQDNVFRETIILMLDKLFDYQYLDVEDKQITVKNSSDGGSLLSDYNSDQDQNNN
jgi:hypothetical protein